MKRLSRGTPHTMTESEVEAVLKSIRDDSVLEEAIAGAFGMTVAEWRRLPRGKRITQWQQLQDRGRLSAIGAASIKARRDFIEQSFMHQRGDDDPNSLADRMRMLETQLQELTDYIRGTSSQTGA